MILSTLIVSTAFYLFNYADAQGCAPMVQSPGNALDADCSGAFFNLAFDAFNPCLCCTETGMPDDNPPNECRFAAIPTASKVSTGQVVCSENFDCCTCESLICSDCSNVVCNGDSSCIGVQNIVADGTSSMNPGECGPGGVIVGCDGDVSCFRTGIYGECVTAINCNGDNSCGQTNMELNLITPVPTALPPIFFIFNGDNSVPNSVIKAKNVGGFTCGGDDSCLDTTIDIECRSDGPDKGCKLEVGGDFAAPLSNWKVLNAQVVSCKGDNACRGSIFDILCVPAGCPVTMTGDDAAPNTILNITNANQFSCAGDDSCPDSNANIDCVSNNGIGCKVTLNGDGAARRAIMNIKNPNTFECVGENGCANGEFNLNCVESGCPISCGMSCPDTTFRVNNSNGILCNGVISNLDAIIIGGVIVATGSCEKASFFLDNNRGGSILCDGLRACRDSTITGSNGNPVENIGGIICSQVGSCQMANINIDPMNNIFNLICSSTDSCNLLYLVITTDDDVIKGISCSGVSSCVSAEIIINKINSTPLVIEKMEYNSASSGAEATNIINTQGDLNINSITCGGATSCLNQDLIINLQASSLAVSVSIFCSNINSCAGFEVTIQENGIALDGTDVLNDPRFDITVTGCVNTQNCLNAVINGLSFQQFSS